MKNIRTCIRLAMVSVYVLGLTASFASVAIAASISFSSTTVGLNPVNTRHAGSSEIVAINYNPTDGLIDTAVPVTVTSSNLALVSIVKVPNIPLGNYKLTIPGAASAGIATVTATATVAGVRYTRSRDFVIVPGSTTVTPPLATTPPVTAGVQTLIRASTPTMNADQSGCAAVNYYDVGPGRSFAALGQLPWSKLKGCDTVRIYPKLSNAAYHEMILVSAGTDLAPAAPNKFMRVIGMPDPLTGALPILDGTSATQVETLPGQAPRTLQYHDNNSASRVLNKLGLVMVGPQQNYNYNFGPAGYISIENLDIRNSVYGGAFTDGKTGAQGAYSSFGSCIYVEAAAHLILKNNRIHNCGNGLFINSKNGALVELSQDVLIEGNSLYNNGNPPISGASNGYSEHQSYTEARDITFQYNYFGDMRPGALGDCLKDRSSGLIVRYNTFASNCGLQLHLVDSTGGGPLIWGDPGYSNTYIYGNLFDLASAPGHAPSLVLYGGDSGVVTQYRQGTLNFYNNTMSVTGDLGNGAYPEVFLFDLLVSKAIADVRNNVFHTTPRTAGAKGMIQAMAFSGKGTVNLNHNWISPNAQPYWTGHLSGAVVNGWTTSLGANNQPGFVNLQQHDFRPAPGSALINGGTGLGYLSANMAPSAQPGSTAARAQDSMIDIGAFEY